MLSSSGGWIFFFRLITIWDLLYITCVRAFFIPLTCVTLSQFNSVTPFVLLTKNNKLWNQRKNYFLYIWLLQRALYQRRQKTVSFLCRHTCMHKKHILTKQWNYNNFAQILHSYVRQTDQALGCVFLVAYCNITRASRRAAFSQRCMYNISLLFAHFQV